MSAYPSFSVLCDESACEAARRLAGHRILARFGHLFPLPLPECDRLRCNCRRVEHRDRRARERRSPYLYTVFMERRMKLERRRRK